MQRRVIDLHSLPSEDLAQLIVEAATLLAERSPSIRLGVKTTHEPAVDYVTAPTATDQRFLATVLTSAKKGEVVRAAEKDRYAGLARDCPAWFAHKGYPASLRGSGARDFQAYGKV